MATDGHLCLHTAGSFGLLGLHQSFQVHQSRIDMMRTEKGRVRPISCSVGHSDVGPRVDPQDRGPVASRNGLKLFPAGGFSSGQATGGMQGLEDCIPTQQTTQPRSQEVEKLRDEA